MSGTVNVNQLLLTYPQCDRGIAWLKEKIEGKENLAFWVIAEEDHHESDGKHLHAFIKLRTRKNMRRNTLSKNFDFDGYHPNVELVKCRKEDVIRVYNYVTKDGDFEEFGISKEAVSNDKRVKVSGKTLLTENPNKLVEEGKLSPYQYTNIVRAQAIYQMFEKPDDCSHCRGIWIYGRPGCGKSTSAQLFGRELGGFFLKPQNKWWDGYFGEPVVILDDLDTSTLNHYLKIWTDMWACKGEIKGGTIWCKHKWFIVTSNHTLDEIAAENGNTNTFYVGAVRRRFVELSSDNLEGEFFSVDDIKKAICERYPDESFDIVEPPSSKLVPPSDPETPHYDLVDFSNGSGFN